MVFDAFLYKFCPRGGARYQPVHERAPYEGQINSVTHALSEVSTPKCQHIVKRLK
jgi:hypothetical protein